jgi:PadR family transcriptional regulator
MRPDIVRGHLDGLLLSTLASAPGHGYALIERLAQASDDALSLPEGTVYPALHRLERDGLIASRWSSDSGRRRRVYSLTAKGRRALGDARAEWSAFSRAVANVMEVPA